MDKVIKLNLFVGNFEAVVTQSARENSQTTEIEEEFRGIPISTVPITET